MDFLLGISPFPLPSPATSSAAPVPGSLTSSALESLPYLPVSTQAVAFPGQVPGAASQGRFSAHQPPSVWRRPESSGEGGRDIYTPGQSPKEQADQVVKALTPWTCPNSTQRFYQRVNLDTVCTSLPSADPPPQQEGAGQAREGRTLI